MAARCTNQSGTDVAVMPIWRALMRLVSGRLDIAPPAPPAIPTGVEETIQHLRDQRREANQQTRLLRDINRRMDPAAALRLARQRREEAR